MTRAVVLFNLGGPDTPEAVRPFLFNLFNDPAIVGAPTPVRYLLARWISARRAKTARAIYAEIGGGSPLLANTRAQAAALEHALGDGTRVFIAMRYWHPMSDETARAVRAMAPERVVLLPLYPQFSGTTTGSSRLAWRRAAAAAGLAAPTTAVCCYPSEPGFIGAVTDLARAGYDEASRAGRPRVLFSAHGLPKRVVAAGDPYQWQVEQSAAAIVAALGIAGLDWAICYQSRVGPLEWIGPSTEAEIARAGRDRVPVVLVPIAFVSEHSETLVELDIEYRRRAAEHGVPHYHRVPTVSTHPLFIGGLARLVRTATSREAESWSAPGGRRICPPSWKGCPAASRG